jgi:pimeloyl-ACP methyl ester carboxylesterase
MVAVLHLLDREAEAFQFVLHGVIVSTGLYKHVDWTSMTTLELARTGTATGSPVLVLHGGGGHFTIAPIAERYGAAHPVFAPTLPGWDGTDRIEGIDDLDALAHAMLDALIAADARGATVIGSSMGGWLALEMAAIAAVEAEYADGLARIAAIDATGIIVDGAPVADVSGLDARGLAELAWFDADLGYRDPATMSPEQIAVQRSNVATMIALTGGPGDPSLASRLANVRTPALVVWGEGDGVVTPAYGQALAAALPNARFELLERAGHLPQLERPEALWAVLDPFVS